MTQSGHDPAALRSIFATNGRRAGGVAVAGCLSATAAKRVLNGRQADSSMAKPARSTAGIGAIRLVSSRRRGEPLAWRVRLSFSRIVEGGSGCTWQPSNAVTTTTGTHPRGMSCIRLRRCWRNQNIRHSTRISSLYGVSVDGCPATELISIKQVLGHSRACRTRTHQWGAEAIHAFRRSLDPDTCPALETQALRAPSSNAMAMTKGSMNSQVAAGSGAVPNSQLPSGV